MATKKKNLKKAVKKSVKKTTQKAGKKAVKKTIKKTVKKSAKKVVKKAVKKTVKKISKPIQKKTSKKTVVKAVSKSVAKPLDIKKVNVDYAKAITPLLDRLVVKVVSAERLTPGGLIIPVTASMATGYLKAEVLAIGTGIKTKKGHLKPLDVKIGDLVLFAEHAGTKVEFNSEELQIIHESDVMGILQD